MMDPKPNVKFLLVMLLAGFFMVLSQKVNAYHYPAPESQAANAASSFFLLLFQSIFTGIVFIICFLNLIMFSLSRKKLFLNYFMYTWIASIFFLSYSGFLEIIVPDISIQITNQLFFLVYIGMALYAHFLYQALRSENQGEWIQTIKKYTIFCYVTALAITSISFVNHKLAVLIGDIFAGLNGFFLMVLIFIMYKRVSHVIRIILIGSQFIVIGGFTTLISDMVNYDVRNVYYYQAGFIVELIFFTLAVNLLHQQSSLEKVRIKLKNSRLEAAQLKKEKETERLQEEIDKKNRNLTCKAIAISQKEALIKRVIGKLSELKKVRLKEPEINNIISELRSSLHNHNWEEFEIHFNNVHPRFFSKLVHSYSNLSPNEKKICAFIKLNLSTKEISEITGKSLNTIDVARGRLRKKMKLQKSKSLSSAIAAIG